MKAWQAAKVWPVEMPLRIYGTHDCGAWVHETIATTLSRKHNPGLAGSPQHEVALKLCDNSFPTLCTSAPIMLDAFFDLPALFQLLVLALMAVVMLYASFLWMDWLHRRFGSAPKLLPVAPALVPATTVFALFLSFLAVDVWNQERTATDSAGREVTAMMRLYELAEPAALNSPEALPLLAAYRHAVLTDEWGVHFNNRTSPAASLALRELRLHGARLARSGASPALLAQWFKSMDDLQDARSKRLLIGTDITDNHQWWVVIALVFFAYLTLAAVHLDRPSAGRLILTLFGIATTIAFWQLAMHANPYNGGYTRVTIPAYFTVGPT